MATGGGATPRIIIDAMGGDHAPDAIVDGAVLATREGHRVVLVGREAVIRGVLARHDRTVAAAIEVIDAPDEIGMDEHAAQAVRSKRGASINVAMRALKEGRGEAVFSAGNSGAVMASALFGLGRLEGVRRPPIAAVLPVVGGQLVICDTGANADCTADHLVQFAHMGSRYAQRMYGIANPRVGLVSNGEEPGKGNALVLEVHPRLAASSLNFIGNVEGRDLPAGKCDVAVCDGFTGNVILKLAEGMASFCFGIVKQVATSRFHYRLAGAVLRPGLKAATATLDYTEHGGAPLLGVAGNVFIGHGSSNARAVASAVRMATRAARANLLPEIQDAVRASLVEREGGPGTASTVPATG